MQAPPADLGSAGLVYVSAGATGIRRRRSGKGFRYTVAGKPLTDKAVLQRIQALAIPPAWEQVWICARANGHIQATGRDARGRKQYRYHPRWSALRDANKFQQLEEFAAALPRIRRQVRHDMRQRKNNSPEKMAAVIVRLLELTLIRIGSQEYARDNKSYGLTTLLRRHASVTGSRVRFQFRGKSGVKHDVLVRDRRIAAVLRRCFEIPGQVLFQYRDSDGARRSIDSGAVNDYLKQAGRADFTARHYRTWAASVYALRELQRLESAGKPATPEALAAVIESTARRLGNTPAICRKCYVHPAVPRAYLEGWLPAFRSLRAPAGLWADERRFLDFLKSLDH